MKYVLMFINLCFFVSFASCSGGKKNLPLSIEDLNSLKLIAAEVLKTHAFLIKEENKLPNLNALTTEIDKLLANTKNDEVKEFFQKAKASLELNPASSDSVFSGLSQISLYLERIHPELGMDFKGYYCPMVEKYWIDSSSEVRNPYAPEMRDCGEAVLRK
jgi:hypothetical protein